MRLSYQLPLLEFDAFQQDVSQFLESLLSVPDGTADQASDRPAVTPTLTPRAELQDTPEAFYLRVELPGIDPQNLTIEVMADSVSISGDRQAPPSEPGQPQRQSEFRYGPFCRQMALPKRVHNHQVEAQYQDGILQLRLPKVGAERPQSVKVRVV